MAKRKKSDKKKRPIAVSVIAVAIVVLFLIRLVQVFTPLISENVFNNGITGPFFTGWRLTEMGNTLLSSASYLILSAAGIVTLIGFLRLRRWSWVLLMTWTGMSLIISLVDYFYSHANYVVMASNVIIAFALNITDIQRMFGVRRDNGSSL
jgi:ABC-type multidrug transport system fused ATPase/permease subunit